MRVSSPLQSLKWQTIDNSLIEVNQRASGTPTVIFTKFGQNSYKPQYFFSISMRNGCLLTIVYKVIIRLTGNCFSYQYMLGATVCLYSQNTVELENQGNKKFAIIEIYLSFRVKITREIISKVSIQFSNVIFKYIWIGYFIL